MKRICCGNDNNKGKHSSPKKEEKALTNIHSLKTHDKVRHGFTLIEILVVISIVGLIAGLLFPVFSRARDSARTATCASNLKQIGLAFRLYLNDNRNLHPVDQGPLGPYANCNWADQIYPYAKSTAIFSCPTDEYGEFRPGCPASEPTGNILYPSQDWDGSYSLNIFTQFMKGGLTGTFSDTRIRTPSETILFCDGHGERADFGNPLVIESRDLSDLGKRHNYGVNVGYADGHVKWKSYDSLIEIKQWQHR